MEGSANHFSCERSPQGTSFLHVGLSARHVVRPRLGVLTDSASGAKLAKQNSEPFSPPRFTSHKVYQKNEAGRPCFTTLRRCGGQWPSPSTRSLRGSFGTVPAVSPVASQRSACSALNSTGDPADGPAPGTYNTAAKLHHRTGRAPAGLQV